MPSRTPRLIIVRHGQTTWSKSGQYTSRTDIPLTAYGEAQMRATGQMLIGHNPLNLLNPAEIKLIITSPRQRAIQTKDLLLEGVSKEERDKIEWKVDEDAREWEYGEYEGMLTKEIQQRRQERNLPGGKDWTIWEYGCEGGEDADAVTKRVDDLIYKVRAVHKKAFEADEPCDIMVIAHGHILRCLTARWIGKSIHTNPHYMLDAGGVCVLSYQHKNIYEPAVYLTGAFSVPVEEVGQSV